MDVPTLVVLIAVVVLVLAILYRRRAGFGSGQTISSDNTTLRSERYGLVGKLDRIVRRGKHLIVEDRKSTTRVFDSHRLQLGVYMLLVEENYGTRPPHGIVVLRDGTREKVKNTRALTDQVLHIVQQIRDARSDLATPLRALPSPGKCRRCAQRHNCEQRVA